MDRDVQGMGVDEVKPPTSAIRFKARRALQRVGLDVAHPRSDYSSIATIERLINRQDLLERQAASRLVKGATRFAEKAIGPTGQLLQDVLACGDLEGALYFVEVGAAHPQELSNTATLVNHFGWSGVRVDPNPEFAQLQEQVATPGVTFIQAAAGTDEGAFVPFLVAGSLSTRVEYIHSDGHAGSRMHSTSSESLVEVPVRSLASLLDQVQAPSWIDYMSIDTEGSELDVLESFPWCFRQVGLITVEHNFDSARQAAFDRLLNPHGLRRVLPDFSAWDAWYLNESLHPRG